MTDEFSSPETAAAVLEFIRTTQRASIRDIAGSLSIGRSTAHRAINRLVRDGAIRVVRLGTGDRYASTYEVVEPAPTAKDNHADRIDELGRLMVWARSDRAPRPLVADALHRYALDRTAWLRGEVPT